MSRIITRQTRWSQAVNFYPFVQIWQRICQTPISRATVFTFAFAGLFLESTLFSTLLFTHTYLVAIQSIAFVLVGTGLGSIAGYMLSQRDDWRFVPLAFFGAILSIPVVYLNIAIFPATVTYSPVMALPFLFGSAVISEAVSRDAAGKILFFDLSGAAAGIVAYVILLPVLGEEGNFIFLALFLATAARLLLKPQGRMRKGWRGLQFVLAGLLLIHLATNWFNLANVTRCYDNQPPTKLFCKLARDPQHNHLIASKSDLAARIDMAVLATSSGKWRRWVQYNGITADKLSVSNPPAYIDDRRVPHGLANQPDVLIIGTAGDGIIKPARLLAGENGRLDGIEINAGLVDFMQNRFHTASGAAYSYLDNLFVGDARTYLNTHDQRYGVITLLNSYTVRLEDLQGAPEYLHTVEAMESYIDHLTPDGFILFEVRDVNELAHASGMRILNALAAALRARNDPSPQDNFFVYDFYPNNQRLVRSNNYTMIIFKRSSFTAGELDYLQGWVDRQNANTPDGKQRTNILYAPDQPATNDYSKFLLTDNAGRETFFSGGRWLTTPTTDERPFLADADPQFPQVKTAVRHTAFLVASLAILLLIFLWRNKSAQQITATLPFLLYFACIGLGYLLIEVSLIQWLQIFTGLPAYTFVFVLGTLLLISGLGSYASRQLSVSALPIELLLLLAVLWISATYLQPLISALQTASLGLNAAIVAIFLAPLAFLMGVPFPSGLRLLKAQFSQQEAALSFGWNSLFAALGGNLAILAALFAGFSAVFKMGMAAYLVAFTALILIIRLRRPAGL